jgi:L-lactate dehydrogenase complex protein LldG
MADTSSGEARRAILARVREKLGVRADSPARRGAVHARLRNPKANVVPERALGTKAERVKRFQAALEAVGAKVKRVKSWKALPEAVAAALREHNLPSRVRMGDDAAFASFEAGEHLVEVLKGPADREDAVSLSHAFAGASESGTLMLVSGKDNPSTLNFLPEAHFAAISADDVMGSYEECWSKLRAAYGKDVMPRTVNWVSGPSRTADIQQTLVQGAHGPRQLVVFIVG